jgi:hypothetical protein
MKAEQNPRLVFVKFTGNDILAEMGRLLYTMLNIFSTNGYQVKLFNNINFRELDKYGQLVPSMPNLALVDSVPNNSSAMLYLYDHEDRACSRHPWRKKIWIKFDVFSTYRLSHPIIMPYPVHPLQSGTDLPVRLGRLRKNESKLRIFFSGDTKGYTQNRIHYPNTKLPRLVVIETILEQLGNKTIHAKDATTLDTLLRGDYINNCVIVDTNSLWVPPEEWLSLLSKTDFFICPPGYCMPMCHNVIEAMAVGSIPIINYPEWFNPTLRHMENCIVFDGRTDLVNKIKSVLEMSKQEITEMRNRVIAYYESYLNPISFLDELESRKEKNITVLMITDKNTIKNASRLNRKSILISGKPTLLNSRWYKFIHYLKARTTRP